MKKRFIYFALLLSILVLACNNDKKNDEHNNHGHTNNSPKTLEDSLLKDIDEGHIVGMSKMARLHKAQQNTNRVLDSIAKLPAKAQQAAAGYVAQLNELMKELEYADFAMEKWMTEYNMDSAKNEAAERIKYLTDEKMKVDKMKAAVLNGLQKADSIFNSNN